MAEAPTAVVVPFTTWNPLVDECIRYQLLIDYSRFTLVLLPNESDSVPLEIANDPRVKVVATHINNISHKRNRGFAACPEAEYYACIDSDAYPVKDWLRKAIEAFQINPEIWCVSGPNISPVYSSNWRRGVANALRSPLVNGPRAFMKRLSSDRYVDEAYSCNMILKREVIEEVGGFDENLETGEDTDLCRRIKKKKKVLYFSQDVVVFHHNRPLVIPFLKQKITAGYSAPDLLKKKFSFSAIIFFLPFALLLFLSLGWLTGFIHPIIGFGWLGCIMLYILVVILEAWRGSETLMEIPHTMIAIIIGNLAPGVGTMWAILGRSIDVGKFFTNFDSRNNPK
jgi:GT2 family glycosyltransferase